MAWVNKIPLTFILVKISGSWTKVAQSFSQYLKVLCGLQFTAIGSSIVPLTQDKPQEIKPSKLKARMESEQPITDGMTNISVITGSDVEDNNDELVTLQTTLSEKQAMEGSSESDTSEQPTASMVQQSENASMTLRHRGLQDLKETAKESDSWSGYSENKLTAIPC